MPSSPQHATTKKASPVWMGLVCAAAAIGLALILDSIRWSSATYDEVAYLRVAARWWRTGEQTGITRMGSPLTFWKLQQAPVLWTLDRLGRGELIDDPIGHQQELLPLVRAGAMWIWLAALLVCACWSRRLYGPRAMALAAWLFALSPNLIAHGGLATMELPLLASTTCTLFLFWTFLDTGRRRWLWASSGLGGLAFSCKFTTILIPPILAVVWWLDGWRRGGRGSLFSVTRQVTLGMAAYVLVLLLADFAITGFAVLPLSGSTGDHPTISSKFDGELAGWIARLYETPVPQDWVGLATQAHHQMSGGSSYLLGERRMTGWRYYYLVALAVKVPLTFWFLLTARAALAWRRDKEGQRREDLLPQTIGLFLAVTAVGSARNYGLRYLLPLAPLAIVWISRLAEDVTRGRGMLAAWPGWVIGLGLAGQALAVAAIHPFELTYFNVVAGGPLGGRHILSDSNLDWGQGLKGLARLQRAEPEFRDLTLYYFGDTNPARYGVEGAAHIVNAVDDQSQLPDIQTVTTRYLAVSASLQWGPWGPPGFFRGLNPIAPVRMTDDTTIAIYRTEDLRSAGNGAINEPTDQ
jgi:4-amino-4-deoxy-L-arabinose transferase-like glycosyltransferase